MPEEGRRTNRLMPNPDWLLTHTTKHFTQAVAKGLRKNIFAQLRLTIPVDLSPFQRRITEKPQLASDSYGVWLSAMWYNSSK